MRIYTKAGDLAFKAFTFPDGQPHFKLETYEREFSSVTIETAIKSPLELFQVILANDVLRQHGYSEVNLDIRYLLGARMDRAIDSSQPFTLQLVARLLNGCGLSKVRILDVHSEVATRLIRHSSNVLPFKAVSQVVDTLGHVHGIVPDKGAIDRVEAIWGTIKSPSGLVYCLKHRDPGTGALSKFSVDVQEEGRGGCYSPFDALIIDDICDGGGTFVGLAKELRKVGAQKVYLYVTHGIFSKGLPLQGIDKIFCTNSYIHQDSAWLKFLPTVSNNSLVVIPISMKELA